MEPRNHAGNGGLINEQQIYDSYTYCCLDLLHDCRGNGSPYDWSADTGLLAPYRF